MNQSPNKKQPGETQTGEKQTREKQTREKQPEEKPTSEKQPRRKQLWASLYLPNLQLESVNPEQSAPIAIIERVSNRQLINSCTTGATAFGINRSMTLNSAYALCPALTAVEYSDEKQQQLLQQLGEWATQFSSVVSLHPPNHLLIEIAGSKRLFESYQILIKLIYSELLKLGFNAQTGVAPNPLAANLLACAACRTAVTQQEKLAEQLKDLPVTLLDVDAKIKAGLKQSGMHKIGALLNISPASLTRRFGPGFNRYLDCLLGRHPYPVKPIRSSEFFERALDLPVEVDDTNALQFATQRMCNELSAFLITRDCGVNSYTFTLRHEQLQHTCITIRFLQATSQVQHLHQVLSERLSQTELPAPVCGLHMLADTFSSIERDGADFFHKSQRQQKSLSEVIDKLCGRLGQDALHTLLTVEDHRPEKAWKKSFPDCPQDYSPDWPQRPLWILDKPKLCNCRLQRISSIERIETGWWDDTDIRRDYFIADDSQGTRYWVFKIRGESNELYIHGVFA